MKITEEKLQKELEGLSKQEEQLVANLNQVAGAKAIVNKLIKDFDEPEKKIKEDEKLENK